jgi:hypothetical protein
MPECIEMEADRVCTIAEWPEQTCHDSIPLFLSFAKFYWYFISIFSLLIKLMMYMLTGTEE